MAYSDEPGTSALTRLLVERDDGIYLKVAGFGEPLPVDPEEVDLTLLELERRSRLFRHCLIGMGVIFLPVIYIGVATGDAFAQSIGSIIKYGAAALAVLVLGIAAYSQAPLRALARRVRDNHIRSRRAPQPRYD